MTSIRNTIILNHSDQLFWPFIVRFKIIQFVYYIQGLIETGQAIYYNTDLSSLLVTHVFTLYHKNIKYQGFHSHAQQKQD